VDALPEDHCLDERYAELKDHVDALRPAVDALACDPDFRTLTDAGYRDDVAGRWWTLSHHRHQRAAAALLERFGTSLGAASFVALAARHQEERRALAVLEAELAEVARARRDLALASSRRAALETALAEVPETVLADLRARLVRTLHALSRDRRLELARTAEPLLELVAIDGVEAKGRYLDAAHRHLLDRTRRELVNTAHDATLALRGQRPLPHVAASALDLATDDLRRDVEQRLNQYRAVSDRLLAFEAYASFLDDPDGLWWDLMVGGLVDGAFVDEVAWHRTFRPRRAPSHMPAADSAARRSDFASAKLAAALAEVRAAPAVPAPVLFDDDG